MAATINGGDSSPPENLYQALLDRCRKLESSHEGLRKQFESLSKETSICVTAADRNYDGNHRRTRRITTVEMTSESGGWNCMNGAYFCGNPYRNILQCIGHAVCVTRPDSGEVIYWNPAAERLFGYKSNELFQQKFTSFLVNEEYILASKRIMERLKHGGTWSGQFPLKKKTGEIFMALMTQSPLYEEENGGGELVGIITVSSDAAVFNSHKSSKNSSSLLLKKKKMNGQDDDGGDDRGGFRGVQGLNSKRISWDSRPQITSFVSDLVHLKKRGEDNNNNNNNHDDDKDENELENPEIKSERPPRIPVRKQIFQFSKSLIEKS